jgi:hypothetical protein
MHCHINQLFSPATNGELSLNKVVYALCLHAIALFPGRKRLQELLGSMNAQTVDMAEEFVKAFGNYSVGIVSRSHAPAWECRVHALREG